MGFTHYDEIVPVTPLTIREMVDSLEPGQKGQILNAFSLDKRKRPFSDRSQIDYRIVSALFDKIDEIEEYSRRLVRGEVLITPEVRDPETGEITTPAVYNTPPTTITALKTQVKAIFTEFFTQGECDAIVNKMIAYSKRDGTGTVAYYFAEVKK